MASGGESTKSKYFNTNRKTGTNLQTNRPSTRSVSDTSRHDSSIEEGKDENIILKKLEKIEKSMVKTDDLKEVVTELVTNIMKQQKEDFKKEIEKVEEKSRKERSKLKGEIDDLRVENDNLRQQIAEKRYEMEEAKKAAFMALDRADEARRWANRNEQYSRKNNVKLYGVTEQNDENTESEIIKLLQKNAEVVVRPEEIVAVHRIPGSRPDLPRPILLKLKNSDVKGRVIRQRSVIKNKKIGVRLADDVTRENSQLMERLNNHDAIETSWFFNGSVYGKVQGSGRKVKFDIDDDIEWKLRKTSKK